MLFFEDDPDLGNDEPHDDIDELDVEGLEFWKPNGPEASIKIQIDPKNRSGTLVLDEKKREIKHLLQRATLQISKYVN